MKIYLRPTQTQQWRPALMNAYNNVFPCFEAKPTYEDDHKPDDDDHKPNDDTPTAIAVAKVEVHKSDDVKDETPTAIAVAEEESEAISPDYHAKATAPELTFVSFGNLSFVYPPTDSNETIEEEQATGKSFKEGESCVRFPEKFFPIFEKKHPIRGILNVLNRLRLFPNV